MRDVRVGVVTLGLVALATAFVAAQAPSTPGMAQSGKATTVAEHTLTGSVVRFDTASKTLSIKTSKGDESVLVASTTKINEGSKKLAAADLSGLSGHKIKIRYQEQNGKMVADSIMVSSTAAPK
jgi:hypothetical protein